MDPNSSLLLQFDPILAPNHNSIPSQPPSGEPDALTMSGFFSRISSQPTKDIDTLRLSKLNRGSLIDLSYNFEDLKSISLDELAHNHLQQLFQRSNSGTENIPCPPPHASPPKRGENNATVSSPRRRALTDAPANATESDRIRRSSLDVSTLTLDTKHRLAAADMSFDILKDDVSFLTNMLDEEHSSVLAKVVRSERVGPIAISHPFKPQTTSTPKNDDAKADIISLPPALPKFDFEPSSCPSSVNSVAQLPSRKSIFDALENTPTASTRSAIRNIVTSWNEPAVATSAPSTISSITAVATLASSTSKPPLAPRSRCTRAPHHSRKTSTATQSALPGGIDGHFKVPQARLPATADSADMSEAGLRRTSSLRTVASSSAVHARPSTSGIERPSSVILNPPTSLPASSLSSTSTSLHAGTLPTCSSSTALRRTSTTISRPSIARPPSSMANLVPSAILKPVHSNPPSINPTQSATNSTAVRSRGLARHASVKALPAGGVATNVVRSAETDEDPIRHVRSRSQTHQDYARPAIVPSASEESPKKPPREARDLGEVSRLREWVNGVATAMTRSDRDTMIVTDDVGLTRKVSSSRHRAHETEQRSFPADNCAGLGAVVVSSGVSAPRHAKLPHPSSREPTAPTASVTAPVSPSKRHALTDVPPLNRAIEKEDTGAKDWATEVVGSVEAPISSNPSPIIESRTTLTRKRSLRQPEREKSMSSSGSETIVNSTTSTSSTSLLRRTKTASQLGKHRLDSACADTGVFNGDSAPSHSSSTAIQRRRSIYGSAMGSKINASAETLPLTSYGTSSSTARAGAAAVKAASSSSSRNTAASCAVNRSRPSIYNSASGKVASMSTSALTDSDAVPSLIRPPSRMISTPRPTAVNPINAAAATITSRLLRRASLIKAPSTVSSVSDGVTTDVVRASTTAKSLNRANSNIGRTVGLVRSRSRSALPI